MADISFYKYIEEAFRFKLYNPKGQQATFATRFSYLGYNLPFGGEKGIFYFARKILPLAYTNKFPDTEEGNLQMAKAVLDKLNKEEKPLESYVDKTQVTQEVYNFIADEARQQSEQSGQAASAGQTPTGEPAGTMSQGGSGPGFPSGLSGGGSYHPPNPRRIFRVPQETPPAPKIAIANKSGVVINEPKTPPPSIAIANKSGNVVGERSLAGEPIKLTTPSKLYVANKTGVVTEERPIKPTSRPRFQAPKIPTGVTSAGKSFASNAGIFFKKNIGKFLTVGRIGTLVSTGIGGLAGAAFGSTGMFAGAGAGAILPSFIKSGGAGRFFGNVGRGTIDAGVRFSNQVSRGGLNLAGPKKKVWLLFLGLFGAVFLFTAFSPPGTPGIPGSGNIGIGSTAPGGGGDISSCKFTRGSERPPEASFKSNLLLSYFQEASNLTGVPAAVLAAFTRVESPSSVNKTDADLVFLSSSAGCPRSPTGALGIMQIQPTGTKGHDAPAVTNGAKLLNIDYSALTEADYCDVRKSVIMGAGFLLKKMSYTYPALNHPGYGDGNKWDPAWTNDKNAIYAMVYGYYGCLLYPSCMDGPNNYGDDVYNSVQACKPTTPISPTTGPTSSDTVASCPVSQNGSGNFRLICGTFNNPRGGGPCGHGNPSYYVACTQPPYASCPFTDQLKAAVDVRPETGNGANVIVYLPFVYGGQSVKWTKVKGPDPISGGADGYKVEYETEYGGKRVRIDLTHLNSSINANAQQSGDVVSTTKSGVDRDGGGHLHTAISVDGKWLDSISEAHLCSP